MTSEPETRYANAHGFHIAYQVLGHPPRNLVMVPGLFSHLEVQWRLPAYRRFMRALARHGCLIRFDKRGTGLSDPVSELPDMQERVADLAAVMDATGLECAALLGFSEGGPIALHFAAAYPERVTGLVLYGTSARNPPDWAIQRLARASDTWGSGATLDLFAPDASAEERRLAGAIERAGASPAMYRALVESLALTDARPLLPRIAAPTLVLHRRQEFIPLAEAKMLAEGIPGARLVELEGVNHHPWMGDWRSVIDEIDAFLAEVEGPAPPAVREPRPRARPTEPARPAHGWASLTPAESVVVELVAQGLSNSAIAERLVVSRYTVETHLKHVFVKLDLTSRSELAALAVRHDHEAM